jgi:hypothetical protein
MASPEMKDSKDGPVDAGARFSSVPERAQKGQALQQAVGRAGQFVEETGSGQGAESVEIPEPLPRRCFGTRG